MELPLPLSVDPGVKEESDLTASASGSSLRLGKLSSSSRRFRYVSPPPSSRLGTQKKGLGISQSQPTPHKPTYTEAFHNTVVATASPSVVLSDEMHHTTAQTTPAVIQAYKVLRLGIFLWKWICFGYFCVAIFDQLKHIIADLRNFRPLEPEGFPNDPDSIFFTLPLEHRLSKLSSLHPIPLSLKPFFLGPREQADSVAACIWTNESGLSVIQEWASLWSGPISLLVTHSALPSSTAYQGLLTRLVSLSQIMPNISFHIQHTSSSLRNFNAYVNIARLFSPSPKVLLFPPSTLTLWGSLPRSSAVLLNMKEAHEQLIIPLLPLKLSNISSIDMSSNTFFATSALLLDREDAPWCTERLFTITDEIKGERNSQLASTVEMGLHWRECIWNIWLRSHGEIQLLHDEGWSDSGAPSLPLQSDTLPETVESNLRARLARKQRFETCFLVAREMVALGVWFAVGPSQPRVEKITGDMRDSKIESTQAKWLRSVCGETLERWGKELIVE